MNLISVLETNCAYSLCLFIVSYSFIIDLGLVLLAFDMTR